MDPKSLIKTSKKLTKKSANLFNKIFRASNDNITDAAAQHEKQAVFRLSKKRLPSPKQIKYGWEILSLTEQKTVKRSLAASGLILVIFLGVFIFNRTAEYPASGGTYNEALLQPPQFLNPVLAFNNDTDLNLNRLLYSGLLRFDENLHIVPDLAQSFEISPDGKTYTIILKEKLTWHDGKELTIDDVIFTFQTIKNPQFNSPHYGKFKDVEIRKIDQRTLQFVLANPFNPFLESLTIGIIPLHIWQNIPPLNIKLAEANLKPIGSGPYLFKKLVKDKSGTLLSYTFESFSDYHLTVPYLKTIQFKFYPNLPSALDALVKQNVDGIEFIPQDSKAELADVKDINLYTFSLPQYTAVFFNQNKNPQLISLKVRQALAYALNKNQLVAEVLNDEAQVIHAPLLPGSIGFHPDITKYDHNPSLAEELLESEGYVLLADEEYRRRGEDYLEITLTTVDVPDNINIASQIRNYWQAIGIKVNLEVVPKNSIEGEIINPRNYQALLFGEILGADPDPFPFWHSSKRQSPGVNLTNFSDKRADALLEQGRTTNNTEDRNKIYQDFQDILIANLPAIFLYSPTYTYPVKNKIKGIEQDTIISPADRFNGITNWYTKTKRRFIK